MGGFGSGGGQVGGRVGGGRSGWMFEVFVKIQKKIYNGGGPGGRVGGGGARVDVNEELKFLWKKKMGGRGVWSGGGPVGGGGRVGGGSGWM